LNKKGAGLFILCILCISSMFMILQTAYFSPISEQNTNNLKDNIPKSDLISTDSIPDYSKEEIIIHSPRNLADFSETYYKYKNTTYIQANETLHSLLANLWDTTWKGFNDTNGLNGKKKTYDNMLMLNILLDYYSFNQIASYLNYAEAIFTFVYNYLWDNQSKLFLSYCDPDGSNPSPQINSTDNAIALIALLKLYAATSNQTYLQIANSTYYALNSNFYDSTYGGYFRSNNSGDTEKYAYDNLLLCKYLSEINQIGFLSSDIQNDAFIKAETTLNLLLSHLLNGTYGFYTASDNDWMNPVETKSAVINALAIDTLLSLYEQSSNQTYFEFALQIADFINAAFKDQTAPYHGYNTTVNWDGSIIINSTKYLATNSYVMNAYLLLFEKTLNSTYYLSALNASQFLTSSLWDPTLKLFNYSVDFVYSSSNSSLKSTYANGLAIQALLHFRYPRPYLTRANTTMTLIEHYMYSDGGFDNLIMYNWSSLASQIISTYPIKITLADLFLTDKPAESNLIAIYTLLELAEETHLPYYSNLANQTMYFLKNSLFAHAFTDNDTIDQSSGKLVFSTETNAWGLLALLKLYESTNDPGLLTMANETWYYIHENLYDFSNFGYNTSTFDNNSKELISNCLMIWANLEIINSNYSIFNNILLNASIYLNQTINSLNLNMWDNSNSAFYSNATKDWTPTTSGNLTKGTRENSIAIQTLLKYNTQYPGHANLTLFKDRINKTIVFLLNHLWDTEYGGFYVSCNENGSSILTDKYTVANSWALLTFIKLYKAYGNFSYYLLAEDISNFLNTYLWDYEYGGFHHFASANGISSILGLLNGLEGNLLIDFKFIESQLAPILALTELSQLKNTLPFSLIVDITFNEENLDRGARRMGLSFSLINLDGLPINQGNASIYTSGLYKTVTGVRFYGFANKYTLQPLNNTFSGTIDISTFFTDFHLTISTYTSSTAVSWLYITKSRLFDIYLTKAFALLNTLNMFFWDDQYSGYSPSLIAGSNDTKYALDNWMAILAFLTYYNASGLNLLYNLTSADLEQLLTYYIEGTFNFINSSLLYTTENQTAIAFYTSSNLAGTVVNSKILCKDTAVAIIALLEYFKLTNNSVYLDMAKKTWLYLNSSLWDSANSGYLHTNGTSGSQLKFTSDNIWAAMANLAIYNTTQINQTIRQSALNMANLTITLLQQNIWDPVSSGYYSSYNGSTWVPDNATINCKTTEVNSLAIQLLLQFASLIPASERELYINYANQTFLYINSVLRDQDFLGYFTSTNYNGSFFNTNKTLEDNSLMISTLLDLYQANLNYTYYQLAEDTLFFISHYYQNSIFTIFHNVSSRYGAINYNFTQLVPVETYSNLVFLQSLSQADLTRQNLAHPLSIDNITTETRKLGEIQTEVNITLRVYDSEGRPIENATVIGVIFGKYQTFSFSSLEGNLYSGLVNVSSLAGDIDITFLAFKDGYSAGSKEHTFSRNFPTYIQKSYETLIALLVKLWNNSVSLLNKNGESGLLSSSANFFTIQALLDFINVGDNVLWTFDWFSNRTFLAYSQVIADNIGNVLNSSTVQVDSKNVSGFLSQNIAGTPTNLTECYPNALAILTFLNLYNTTGDTTYLEMANNTWLYLNTTFWDPENFGYFAFSGLASNKTLFDNCMAILANLAINQTLAINPTIRAQASTATNLTFFVMNQSLWDNTNGTYFSSCDSDWSNPTTRFSYANAIMILTLLELYKNNPTHLEYLVRANITADIFMDSFYDSYHGGFYQLLSDSSFKPPILAPATDKFLFDNAWAILALANMYEITGNRTYYYRAEDTLNFINSHLANHFNEYLNNKINDINGYWDFSKITGFVSGKPQGQYIGSLEPSALIINAMLKLFTLGNSTLPLLNTTVQITAANTPPLGEFCNLTITIYDEYGTKISADLNITISGWTRITGASVQELTMNLPYEFDPNTLTYYVSNVNLSTLEDVYFTVYVKNQSYAAWWQAYYLHRTQTGFSILWGVGGDYVPSENYWQYTIGDDTIIIEAYYTDFSTFQGIPGAIVNFTIYYPNGTLWFTESVLTNSTGWARLVFGPIPEIAELFGQYNISVSATHVDTTISPITWYGSTTSHITINVDFGISILDFYPLDTIAVQGDIIQCNITVKHRKLSNVTIDINIYSQGTLIPTTVTKNVTTGLNIFILNAEIDERTPIGLKSVYVNITYQGRFLRQSSFAITILSAAIIRNYYVPTWIAAGDVRYATVEIEHRKFFDLSNISVKIDCVALEENPLIQTLQPLAWQEYYFPLIVKSNIPYGLYSGEIIIERVNYTLTYNDAPLTFQIEVKPPTEVLEVNVPSSLAQNQRSMFTVNFHNYKTTPSIIKIVGYGSGFNTIEETITISPGEIEAFNFLITYNALPWDIGLHEYTIEIYYLNESSQFTLINSNIYQVTLSYSLNNILLGFVLPGTLAAILVIWILWHRDKKRRERKKLK